MLAFCETYVYTVQVLVRYTSLHSFALVTNIIILTAFLTSFHVVVNDSLHLTWAQYRSYTFLSVQIPCPEFACCFVQTLYDVVKTTERKLSWYISVSQFTRCEGTWPSWQIGSSVEILLHFHTIVLIHRSKILTKKVVFAKIKFSVSVDNQGMSY